MRVISIFIILIFGGFSAVSAQTSPREYFKFAKFKYDKGDQQGALDFLNKAIEADSGYVSAYLLRSEVNFSMTNYYSTINDVDRAFKLEGKEASFATDYTLLRGKAFAMLKEYDHALTDINDVLQKSPGNATAYFERGKIRYRQSDYRGALDDLDKAIGIDADHADFYAERAQLKNEFYHPIYGSDQYKKVLADFNVAIALDPDNYQYYELRSEFQESMGLEKEALSDYNQMIKLSPHKDDAYTKRGVIRMHEYDYKDAITDFSQSIDINPEDERNYRYRGLCYHNVNDFNKAYKDFTQSIDLLSKQMSYTNDNKEIQNVLAETYILRGHCLNIMGNNGDACRDFLKARDLGAKKGLNYYRKFCGIY